MTEFTTYCTWYYIYTGCYTLYLRNFHFHRAAERTWFGTRKAQERKNEGGEGKDGCSRKRRKREQHPTCWYTHIYIPFSSAGGIDQPSRFSRSVPNPYWEKSLPWWDLQRRDREKPDAGRTSMEEGQDLGASGGTKTRANRIYREWTTNDRVMNPASWQTTKCRCFFEVAGGPKVD